MCVVCVVGSVLCSGSLLFSLQLLLLYGRVVVVGTRGGAGAVVGSSLSPRDVLGVVATVDTAAHTVAMPPGSRC